MRSREAGMNPDKAIPDAEGKLVEDDLSTDTER